MFRFVFVLTIFFSGIGLIEFADGGHVDHTMIVQSAQDPTHPVAEAGQNRTIAAGTSILLNGTLSSDDVAITGHAWSFYDAVQVSLYGPVVEHRFLSIGVFNITLNVTDADGNWDTDSVIITVIRDVNPPVAEAGLPRTVSVKSQVFINGSASSDNSGYIANYTWTFVYDGQQVTIYGPTAYVWFNKTGTYVLNLTVADLAGLSATDNTTVIVQGVPTWLDENIGTVLLVAAVVGMAVLIIFSKWRRDHSLFTSADMEKLALYGTRSKRVWRQFRGSRTGMLGLVILAGFLGMAISAEPLYDVGLIQNPNNWIESSDPLNELGPPSSSHLLGTDDKGRDVLSDVFFGSRNSLIVGFAAAFITMVLGAGIGLMAGTYGRGVDEFLMRLTDLFLVIPWLPFAVILAAFLPPENQPSMTKVIIVIGVTSWPATARIVRSQVLSIRERAFVERAMAIGSGKLHIMSKHLLPNVFPLVFANAILSVSYAILSEAFLSFFGLSDQKQITWGLMLYNAFTRGGFFERAYWFVLPPGLCIILVVLGFTFVSYALDDILNPRLRKR